MAKKKNDTFNLKSTINAVVEKSISKIMAVVAENSLHIIEWIKSLPNFKRKIKHVITAITLVLAGMIVLALGISDYLAAMFPNLANGLSHIIVGAVLIIVAMMYVKMD